MSTAPSIARAAQPAAHSANQRTAPRPATDTERTLRMGTEEAAVLNIDLTGLQLPKVGGLNVDGFKPSLFQRLFGRR